ncbi:MAG: GNAT family N-acetyltransferase [Chloroflexi bacterium]|nr:GNAT family N-acetyltransferase [Chloroflexota bacterium]
MDEQWAFVYNVYTEPPHRRQGLARRLMETIHQWCRERGLKFVGLNASEFGRPLYEALGYQPSATLMMLKLEPVDSRR